MCPVKGKMDNSITAFVRLSNSDCIFKLAFKNECTSTNFWLNTRSIEKASTRLNMHKQIISLV
jgi:hypothetical protein